jgi:hypothetical protein
MKSTLLLITLLKVSNFVFSQDTIVTIMGNKIIAKVIEVNLEDIKYKKIDNIDGPNYVLNKNEIEFISYKNGQRDIFSGKITANVSNNSLTDEQQFVALTKRHNKVYINSENKNAITHANNFIRQWGYWIVTEEKASAHFILNFNVRSGGIGDRFGNANFIDPQSGRILKSTKEVNTLATWDLNTKRGLIHKIVNKQIKKMFKN